MRKKICLFGLLAGLALSACAKGDAGTANVPELLKPVSLDMDTVAVKRDTIYNVEVYNADVIPRTDELSFGSSGTLGAVNVAVGDPVKKGQLLAELREEDFKKELEGKKDQINELKKSNKDQNALSEYDIAIQREELKQLKKELKAGKDKSKTKQLKLNIKEKESDIKIAEKRLVHEKQIQQLEVDRLEKEYKKEKKLSGYFEIRSKRDGVVACILVNTGAMLNMGSTVMAVADTSRLKIACDFISDTSLNKCDKIYALHNDKQYEIALQDYDREEAARRIEQGFKLKLNFNFKGDTQGLQAGDFISVCLVTDYVEDALVIPANALFRDGESRYVYKVEGQGKTKQEVSVGTITPAYVQVKDGLQEGDVVYAQK